MRGAGHEDVLVVLQVPGNKAGAVPCERLRNLIDPMPGAMVELQGHWKIHPKYGEQFEVEEYRTTVPATIHGIKKYLGSGLIKGIGLAMPQKYSSNMVTNQ